MSAFLADLIKSRLKSVWEFADPGRYAFWAIPGDRTYKARKRARRRQRVSMSLQNLRAGAVPTSTAWEITDPARYADLELVQSTHRARQRARRKRNLSRKLQTNAELRKNSVVRLDPQPTNDIQTVNQKQTVQPTKAGSSFSFWSWGAALLFAGIMIKKGRTQ